ncbi:hypothetical protein [Piscinibacter sp. HJYY11]|uniref:hypothetical protein n=1 Tax=Piscinibacter sp. HJYY11 TaxID=2801333 RepID=UPI00191F7392|nr:hypothetical protein [Piscinibacter sp. HJYY11]MBL0726072.1 hypothetical protein [Piscinibacter sp. HJYY11]
MRDYVLFSFFLLPTVCLSVEQQPNADRHFTDLCTKAVDELYSDPEIEPLFPSVPDAVSTTCKCVHSRVSADVQLLSTFQRLNGGGLTQAESKKLNAYVFGRFLVGALSCMANDIDRATKGIGPRGVG